MKVCVYCKTEKNGHSCCGENHWEELKCPECESTDVIYATGLTSSYIETYYTLCEMCNHQWGHE